MVLLNGTTYLAHSERLAFPKIIAPAFFSLVTTSASRIGFKSSRASAPAVVCIESAVPMLSFIRIGIPCSELPMSLNGNILTLNGLGLGFN